MGSSINSQFEALQELYHEVGIYSNGKELKELFDFIDKFPKIAPYNAMLLHIQKPGSRYVASAYEWRKDFNRTIKPGARPLIILYPFGPVRFVFELADTVGEEPFPQTLLNPFKTKGFISKRKFNMLLDNLSSYGVAYYTADHGTDSAGFIQKVNRLTVHTVKRKNVKVLYNLVVNRNHSDEEIFATIVHELGHLFCGHLGTPNPDWWQDNSDKKHSVREFEAESVSWLVCNRFGIKTPSAEYLSGYLSGSGTLPAINLTNILKAAGKIEAMTLRPHPIHKDLIIK